MKTMVSLEPLLLIIGGGVILLGPKELPIIARNAGCAKFSRIG